MVTFSTIALLRGVGDGPESVDERDDGSGAAFVFVIKESEVRVDAGERGLLELQGSLSKAY